DLVSLTGRNHSTDVCEQDLAFLAAAAGTDGGALEFDPDAPASSRLLAIARGAKLGDGEARELARARSDWAQDAAGRKVVVERALGGRPALDGLVAAETRKAAAR